MTSVSSRAFAFSPFLFFLWENPSSLLTLITSSRVLYELISLFLIDLQRLFRLNISINDLTYSQTLAIISIPDDGIEMSDLAWTLGLDNSTVTRLVIRLEKKNWVERKQSLRDQRAIEVFLTDKGAFEHTWRVATAFSKSKLVPKHFQDKPF